MSARTLRAVFALSIAAGLGAQDPGPAPAPAPQGRAEGRVLGPLGDAMVAVEVWAALWPNLDQVIGRTRTDGNGYFVLPRLPLRAVTVCATADGHTVGSGTVQLSAGLTTGGTILRLWPASTIRGRVVDADGAPVPDAIVLGTKDYTWYEGHFRSPETRTDAAGRFELRGIPIGDQVVRVWQHGFVMREQWLFATTDSDVEVALVRGSGVQLQIRTEGVARELAPAVEVSMYPTRGGSGFRFPFQLGHGRLDMDGRWSLAGMPDCEWNIELRSPDYAFDPHLVRTKAGVPLHELSFTATPQGALQLRGTLTSVDGDPLAGETLVCRTQRSPSMNGGRPGTCTTDAQGRFTLAAPLVPEERYSLHLVGSRSVLQQAKTKDHTGERDARYLVRYEDTADPQRLLALVAVPAAFVCGKVVDADGAPVPFRWCELQVWRDNSWSQMAYATSQRDGTLAFPGAHGLDADLRIEVEGQAGSAYSEPFRAAAGKEVVATVAVPRTGRIRGRLLDAVGKPMAGARLMVQNYHLDTGRQIDGSWTNVMTDREGCYAFVGVAPVGHKLTVKKGDKTVFTTELFGVGAGKTVDLDIRLPADDDRK